MPSVPFLRRFFGSAVSNAAGYSVGGAIQPTLEPYTQDLANQTWALHSVKPLNPSAAAAASLRGIMDDGDARAEASMTGINGERYAALRRLAANPPAFDALLMLRRRDAIDETQFDRGLAQLGIHEEWRPRVKALLNVLPSVEDQVRFAVREAYDPASVERLDLDAEFPQAFADAAEAIGLPPSQARLYWRAHWQLPSREEGAEMLHRGLISQETFHDLLKALDFAPTWRDKLEEISAAIPTLEDFTRMTVREVFDPAQRRALGLDADYPAAFTEKAALHGLSEEYARDYWAAHWRLPSARQGYVMFWRGEITAAELDGLLKALDYPAIWRDRLASIAHVVPGRIDLKRMFKLDLISRDDVHDGYIRIGYAPDDAERMTRIAEAEKNAGGVEQPWLNRAKSRLFTVAHNEFMDESLGEADARALLARVGASPGERDGIIELWKAEAAVDRRELTPSQIVKAYKKTLLTHERAVELLLDRSYTREDAEILLGSA